VYGRTQSSYSCSYSCFLSSSFFPLPPNLPSRYLLSLSFSFFVFCLSPLCTYPLLFWARFHCQPCSTTTVSVQSHRPRSLHCESPSGKEGKKGKHRREEEGSTHAHAYACGRGDIYARLTNQARRSQAASSAARATINSPLLLSSPEAPLYARTRSHPTLFSSLSSSSSTIWNTSFSLSFSLGFYLRTFSVLSRTTRAFLPHLDSKGCEGRREGLPSRKSAALMRARRHAV